MKAYILTGLSGAGKSLAIRHMEDLGLLCVDNLPAAMLHSFLELCNNASPKPKAVAMSIDIRSAYFFGVSGYVSLIEEIKSLGYDIEIIFLEASMDVLINRYKESRREHPLSNENIGLPEAISLEKDRMEKLKESSSYLIDTSNLKSKQLKKHLDEIIMSDTVSSSRLRVRVMSFGFKRGVPDECDLVFDVRFLKNPFYIPELKEHSGLEEPVYNFVINNEVTQNFLTKLEDMLKLLIPNYIAEGKQRLVIGIGCTGGMHRSVAITQELCKRLENENYSVKQYHRDLELEQSLQRQI